MHCRKIGRRRSAERVCYGITWQAAIGMTTIWSGCRFTISALPSALHSQKSRLPLSRLEFKHMSAAEWRRLKQKLADDLQK